MAGSHGLRDVKSSDIKQFVCISFYWDSSIYCSEQRKYKQNEPTCFIVLYQALFRKNVWAHYIIGSVVYAGTTGEHAGRLSRRDRVTCS